MAGDVALWPGIDLRVQATRARLYANKEHDVYVCECVLRPEITETSPQMSCLLACWAECICCDGGGLGGTTVLSESMCMYMYMRSIITLWPQRTERTLAALN